MTLKQVLKFIVDELSGKAQEPLILDEKNKNELSRCINDLIWTEEDKNPNLIAVYVTAYWTGGTVHIYVNFVDHSYCEDYTTTVSCKVNGIIIDRVMKSSGGFSCSQENDGELQGNVRELLDCLYYKTYYDLPGRPDWYETNTKYARNAKLKQSNNIAKLKLALDSKLKRGLGFIPIENANKRIIHEQGILNEAYKKAVKGLSDPIYSEYNSNCANRYRFLSGRVNEIIGLETSHTFDDFFIKYVDCIDLELEQIQELTQLRESPIYIKAMGEAALEQKSRLEKVLGTQITSYGNAFEDEEGLKYATKTEQQLDREFSDFNNMLSELLKSGRITGDEYDSYVQNLDYIHAYYVSCSKGEQVRFRKMTNADYELKRRYPGIDGESGCDRHACLQELQEQSAAPGKRF